MVLCSLVPRKIWKDGKVVRNAENYGGWARQAASSQGAAFIDLNEWQIAEIKTALKEADAGDFASEKEVQAVMRKWRRGARKMA